MSNSKFLVMYDKKLFTGLLAITLLFLAGCEKEKNPEKKGVFVSTTSITNITLASPANTISATAGGDADLVGDESITERGVCWATTPKPTTTNNKTTAGTGTGNFSANLTGLTFGAIYYLRAYVISNGKAYYGNEVKFTASVPVQLIKNGDFELPIDPGISLINSLPNWKTYETDAGIIGRGTDSRNPTQYVWTYSASKSFFQVVGTVPALQSDYAISFRGNYDWTDWGNGYDATIGVIFSVYSGSDPSTRVPIDTVKITTGGFPGWGDNWKTKTAAFSLPAGSAYAGKNLVIEFDLLPYVDPTTGDLWDDTVWYNFDNISVIQTLR
jgi:hypothetical protein